MAHSAYIHIPFCSHKCDFCDFTAFAGLDHLADEYCEVVCREIAECLAGQELRQPLTSVFYGGGTPGLIDPGLLSRIHETLRQAAGIAPDAEVTLETTPTSVSRDKALKWLSLGVNRISIGVQSLQDNELNAMGRGHSRQEALEGVELARQAGFENLSLDLMYGLPNQTLESWTATLTDILALQPSHLSAYGLTIATNSPLLSRYPRDCPDYPSEDAFACMYQRLVEMAEGAGLSQYEISNFSRPGFESKHNYCYWRNEEYLAFGVGAHRYVDGVRSSNWRSLKRYLKDWRGHETEETITPEIRRQEAVFLALRTRSGIDLESFKTLYGLDLQAQRRHNIDKLVEGGFLELTGGRLTLSQKGVLVSNTVISELV